MTLTHLAKAPFPWFGGKSRAAETVWGLLGDVEHYVEPFAGSLAVLLRRPHPCNRSYYSETVNDLDGFVVNFWRAIAAEPDATAEAASWPVSEADKSARQIALLRWRDTTGLDRLAGDVTWCDPVMAGWWAWAVSVQIGAFDGRGPWVADPATGRIVKQRNGVTREPGVARGRPHLGNNGEGVNHAGVREPGVMDGAGEFHPVTMPELRRWFAYLAARLRHVRIVNGDWSRVVTPGASKTVSVRQGGTAGLFLDPPYDMDVRADVYGQDRPGLARDVRAWCLANGDDPQLRIVLSGYDNEGHDRELLAAGWAEHEWFTAGFLTGGMGNVRGAGLHQQHRERLWASPHCLTGRPDHWQESMFGEAS